MKRLFKSLFAMMLCAVLSMSVFACKKDQKPKAEEPVVIVAVDGVNVQNVIDAFGPIAESEYLTINLDFGMESGEETAYGEGDVEPYSDLLALSAEIKIKKTSSGYDFIARVANDSLDTGVEGGMSIVLYYVGGRMVVAYEMAGEVVSAEGEDEKYTFNAIINDLNRAIANDPEMRETYETVLAMSQEVKALFDQGVMANLNEMFDIDLKEDANNAFTYLKANAQKTLYEIIVAEMEITQTEAEVEEIIFTKLEEYCADNPTIAVFIDRVVSAINAELEPESQINVREICDALEAEGLSAAVLCEIVNYFAELEALPAPDANASLYDYLYSLTSTIRVDDLAQLVLGSNEVTVADLVAQLLQAVKQTTLGDVVYEQLDIDLETLSIVFSDLNASAAITTDSKSRLTGLSVEYAVSYTMTDEIAGQSSAFNRACLTVEISYQKFDTNLAIPQKVLNLLG